MIFSKKEPPNIIESLPQKFSEWKAFASIHASPPYKSEVISKSSSVCLRLNRSPRYLFVRQPL